MKKPKIKLDSAVIQSFFVHHVEKVVLVVVLGVMAWLVYSGYSLPGLESGKTPAQLKQVSSSTRQFIDDPNRWANDVAPERVVDNNLVGLVEHTLVDTDPAKYFLPHPLSLPDFQKLEPRKDPELFAPLHLEVEVVYGPLATYPEMGQMDPLYEAPPEEPAPKKPARKPSKRSTAGGPEGGMYDGMSGMPGYGGSGAGSGSGSGAARGKRGARASRGSSSGSETTTSEDTSMAGMSPYGSAGGYGSGMMSGVGGMSGINPESILGFQTTDQMTIASPTQAMVIKAVVPFEKQDEVFLNSLGNSLDYDPQRDRPQYLGFWVERAEVPADALDADPAALKWTQLGVRAALAEQIGDERRPAKWAGVLTDIVDPAYLDPNLTHPAPPFMQRDVWNLLTHAEVPLATTATAGYGGDGMMMPGGVPKDGAPPTETDVPSDLPTFPGAAGAAGVGGEGYGSGAMPGMSGSGGYGSGSSGYGSGMPGGSGGMPGSGGMMRPRPPAFAGSGSGGYGSGAMPGMSGGYGSGDSSMGGYGSGMGGSGMGGYGGGMAVAPPKYKLVRFTDAHVEEGKYYRYRVKVLLHDPNHPATGLIPPTLASLDPKVRERVKALDAADAKRGPTARTYWVESPWSEPSEVVSLPASKQYYVGNVDQPASVEIVPGKPKVPSSQPKAKVLTNVWDPTKVVDVPAEVDVFRGSILNFVQDAKVIHPVTHEVVDLTKYAFQTNAIVADLSGGELIPAIERKNDKPLAAPGEMLIFDAAGNLHVQNETDDIDSFRRLLLPKEDPNKAAGQPGAEGMMPGEMGSGAPGYGDLMQSPGSGSGGTGYGGRGRSSRGSGSRGGSMP